MSRTPSPNLAGEPLAMYGDYPALYCLGAEVPSSRFARKTWKRVVVWAVVAAVLASLASGGLYASKRYWSPEQTIAQAEQPKPAAK